jgi:hypothetical protein
MTSSSAAHGDWSNWSEGAASAPIKRPSEAYEIAGIQAFQDYSLAAAVGALDSSLGPLLALSIIAGRSGLQGVEIFVKIEALAQSLAAHGRTSAARELLEGATRGFLAGGDHQSAADLAELVAVAAYRA